MVANDVKRAQSLPREKKRKAKENTTISMGIRTHLADFSFGAAKNYTIRTPRLTDLKSLDATLIRQN